MAPALQTAARRLFRRGMTIAVLGLATRLWPHVTITTKLTWSREVSRIVYRRCVSCHRDRGSAFSLVQYEEARPWAQAIKEEVLARRMPPWFAVKGFGRFKDDAGLTREEIEIITEWVEGGAPKGDERLLPPLPEFSEPSAGEPQAQVLRAAGLLRIQRDVLLTGIRPLKLERGSSIRVIAERPNGILEPLIWIYNYDPRFPRTYYFETPFNFPAGTRIHLAPPEAGAIALLIGSARNRPPMHRQGEN